jgi:hypothetical protein
MKPPSRKHYEKNEVERLKDRIAKLEKKQPEALGIQSTIEALRSHAKRLLEERNEMLARMGDLHVVADWFDVLKRSEVMIPTEEGMKYLVGQDLEDFCRAEIEKQNTSKIWWSDSTPTAFSGFANQAISQIIRDEVDKLAESQLDAYRYITKGRYDTRSKSKKESR